MDSIYSKYRDNFRGKQIGLIVVNSCDDAITSTRKVMNLEQTGIVLENGEHLNLTNRIIGMFQVNLKIIATIVLPTNSHFCLTRCASWAQYITPDVYFISEIEDLK